MTRTRHRSEREAGPLTPKPAKPGLSDEEVAWRLHQELNANMGSPALRTRTRHHDAEVQEASPSTSKAGQDETPSAVRVTRSRAREPEDKPAVSHRPTTRGVRVQMPPAVNSRSESDVEQDEKVPDIDDGAGEDEMPRARARGDVTEPTRPPQGKKEASSAPSKATQGRMPKIPKLPMVLQDDGSWYRARVIRDSAERVLIEFTGFEHQFPSLWLAKVDERIWRGSYKGKDWKYLGGGAWAPKHARSTDPSYGRLAGKKRPRSTGVFHQDENDDEGRPLQEDTAAKSQLEGEEEVVAQSGTLTRDNEGAVIKVDAENRTVGKARGGSSRRLLDPIVREALARGESLMYLQKSDDGEWLDKAAGSPTGRHTMRDGSHHGDIVASKKNEKELSGRATRKQRKKRDVTSTLHESFGRTPTPETPLGRSSRRASLLLPSPAGGEKLHSWLEDEGDKEQDCAGGERGDDDGASLDKRQDDSHHSHEQTADHQNASSQSQANDDHASDEAILRNKQTTPVPAPRRRRKPATCSRAPTGMALDTIACSPTSKARLAREAAALVELERRLEEEEQARERERAQGGTYHAAEEASVASAVPSTEKNGDGAPLMNDEQQQQELLITARSWRGESGGLARHDDDARDHHRNNDDDRSSDHGATTNRLFLRQRRKAAGRARIRTSTWSYELAEEHGRQDHFAARYDETRRQQPMISRLERKRGRPSAAQQRRAAQARRQEDGLLLSKGVFNTILGALSSFAGEAPPAPMISRRGEAWGTIPVAPATPVAAVVGAGSHSSLTLFNSWSETRWHKTGDSGSQPRILRVKEELFTPRASSVSSGASPFDQSVAAPPLPLFQ